MGSEVKRVGGHGRIAEVTAHRKAMGLPVGRQRGSVNKLTKAARDGLLHVYEDLGGHEGFAAWARKHRTQFYALMLKSIPKEREANALGSGITIAINTSEGMRPVIDVTPDADHDPE